MSRMGDLANAFDVPDEQSTNVGWANRLGEILTARPQYDETVQYKTASPLINITEGDIGRATEAAMAVSGGGMKVETPRGIRAFHSSPHDFDKFDLAKIGTGEGAQVYGHGLYFAENPAVSGQGGQYWQQFANRFGTAENSAAQHLAQAGFDRQKAAQTLRDMIANPNPDLSPHNLKTVQNIRQGALKLLESDKPVGPRTYEVNINADPAHMLDWDKALYQQPEVYDKIKGYAGTVKDMKLQDTYKHFLDAAELRGMPGSDFYQVAKKQGPAALSQDLREAGIPGIKYLDQGSRIPAQRIADAENAYQRALKDNRPSTAAEWKARLIELRKMEVPPPSSNFVIFDPNLIDITKKYAVPGAIGAGGMGALAAQDEYSQ